MFENWIIRIVHHRRNVLTLWLILVVIGLFGSSHLNSNISTSLSVPGSQSEQADKIMANHFGENTQGTFTILYKFGNASDLEDVHFL